MPTLVNPGHCSASYCFRAVTYYIEYEGSAQYWFGFCAFCATHCCWPAGYSHWTLCETVACRSAYSLELEHRKIEQGPAELRYNYHCNGHDGACKQ